VQVCADVLRAAYWFDPLLWMACARLRRDSEQACDDVVLGAGVAADRYAVHLLAVAREARGSRRPAAPALPMARRTTLERRISAMLNPGLDRSLPSPRLVFALAAPILALTVTVGVVRGAQTTPLPLTGTVFDPTGAVVPAVELTLSDDQQHALQSASADGSGRFVFEGVAPGRYVLEAAMPGFRRLRQDLELRRAGDWERAVTLQVGDVTETISVRSKRPAAPRPSASSAGAAPLRVGGNIRPPRKLKDVKPEYPASMREAGLEGMVPVLAVIGRDGNIHSLRALSAQVHPDFVASALEAVRQWRFEPTLLNGAPVEVAMTVTVEFSLSDQ
jgi:TonB family protein